MEYPKQKKTKWWLILLFIPLLVGCNPITGALYEIELTIGDKLIHTLAGSTIEIVFDKLTKYLTGDVVDPDPKDPLRGYHKGNLVLVNKETPNCQLSYTVKHPEMYREATNAPWKPVPQIQKEVKEALDKICTD